MKGVENMSCNPSPSSNITCLSFGANNSYGVAQPRCVILPDGSIERNPFFDSSNELSFWAYKVLLSCDIDEAITDIYIPIFESISEGNLSIFERILSCGTFGIVPFDFSSPMGITPPENLKFVHIPVSNRYSNGASVYYRFQIVGNFPQRQETIYLKTGNDIITLNGNYRIPGEPDAPNLGVTKNSEVVIVNNQATINYTVNVTNIGITNLQNVQYTDMINYDGVNTTIGDIEVTPEGINVDTSMRGLIKLTGNLGNISLGESVQITYSVPIISFNVPNTFVFNSSTMVTSANVITTINTIATVEVVQFETFTSCNVLSNNAANFTVSISSVGNSPEARVFLQDIITVPAGLTVRFTSLNDCLALFLDTLDLVRLNTDVTNRSIFISCPADITPNSIMTFTFSFTIMSTTSFDPSLLEITNFLDGIIMGAPSEQVYLGAAPIGNTVILEAGGETLCSSICTPPQN